MRWRQVLDLKRGFGEHRSGLGCTPGKSFMLLGYPIGEIALLALWIAGGGILVGILAGLFGIGGGAIIVPVLYEVFRVMACRKTCASNCASAPRSPSSCRPLCAPISRTRRRAR